MKALFSSAWRSAVVAACAVGSPWASATPVVQAGSSYSLSFHQASAIGAPARSTLSFDGVAETFVLTPNAGAPVRVTAQESQVDLGGGRAAIDIGLSFTGADPYPDSTFSGLGLGLGLGLAAGDVLDLTGPVSLSAAMLQGVAGDGSLLSYDALADHQRLGTDAPWNGALFGLGPGLFGGTSNYFLDLQWGGIGLRQLNFHFETQVLNPVGSPGTAPLLALGLVLGLLARSARHRSA